MTTRDQIVKLADRFQKQRGYSGWSFGDISAEVGIRRASIHHHFPTRGALLAAVIEHNAAEAGAFAAAWASRPPHERLAAFLDGYDLLFEGEGLCTCGALTVGGLVSTSYTAGAVVEVNSIRAFNDDPQNGSLTPGEATTTTLIEVSSIIPSAQATATNGIRATLVNDSGVIFCSIK